MDELVLEDVSEEQKNLFGGPDVVRLQEKRLNDKRKREIQIKRAQMEKMKFISQVKSTMGEEKYMSRDERKLQKTIMMIQEMSEREEKEKKKLNKVGDEGFSIESQGEAREADEKNDNSAQKAVGNHHMDLHALHLRKTAGHTPSRRRIPILQFNPTVTSEEMDEFENTHVNMKHKLENGAKLMQYIKAYETRKGEGLNDHFNKVVDRLIERQSAEERLPSNDTDIANRDKLSENIGLLCDKLRGLDLNQPLKSLVAALK